MGEQGSHIGPEGAEHRDVRSNALDWNSSAPVEQARLRGQEQFLERWPSGRRRWTGIPVTSSRVFVGSNPTLSARKDAKALSRKRAFFIFAVALAHVRLHSSNADVPPPCTLPRSASLRRGGDACHRLFTPPSRPLQHPPQTVSGLQTHCASGSTEYLQAFEHAGAQNLTSCRPNEFLAGMGSTGSSRPHQNRYRRPCSSSSSANRPTSPARASNRIRRSPRHSNDASPKSNSGPARAS